MQTHPVRLPPFCGGNKEEGMFKRRGGERRVSKVTRKRYMHSKTQKHARFHEMLRVLCDVLLQKLGRQTAA